MINTPNSNTKMSSENCHFFSRMQAITQGKDFVKTLSSSHPARIVFQQNKSSILSATTHTDMALGLLRSKILLKNHQEASVKSLQVLGHCSPHKKMKTYPHNLIMFQITGE